MRKLITLLILALAINTYFLSNQKQRKTSERNVKKEVNSELKITNVVNHFQSTSSETIHQSSIFSEAHKIAQKVFLSNSDRNKLNTFLESKEVQDKIINSLTSKDSFNESEFVNRMRSLDLLYEGIKSTNKSVADKYLNLTEEIFNKTETLLTEIHHSSIDSLQKEELIKQIRGDKVEILMIVNKISSSVHKELSNRLLNSSESNISYIKKAKAMGNIYEVSI